MLRKRVIRNQPTLASGKGKAKLETRDPRDLEQLVQQVMKELPTRVQDLKTDPEKVAALAKLDKGFDG